MMNRMYEHCNSEDQVSDTLTALSLYPDYSDLSAAATNTMTMKDIKSFVNHELLKVLAFVMVSIVGLCICCGIFGGRTKSTE